MKKQSILIDPFLLRGSMVFAKLTPDATKILLWILSESFSVDHGVQWEPTADSIRFFRYDQDEEDQDAFRSGLEQLKSLGLVGPASEGEGLLLQWEILAEMGITRR